MQATCRTCRRTRSDVGIAGYCDPCALAKTREAEARELEQLQGQLPAGYTLERRPAPESGYAWIAEYAIRDASGEMTIARRTARETLHAFHRDRGCWPAHYGVCRLSDHERSELARWAFYNIGAQMTGRNPYASPIGPELEPCGFCGAPAADDVYREEDHAPVACCSDEEACHARKIARDDGPRLPYACPRCEQLSDTPGRCPRCVALERAPQGETVRLLEPAPAQMPGQTSMI